MSDYAPFAAARNFDTYGEILDSLKSRSNTYNSMESLITNQNAALAKYYAKGFDEEMASPTSSPSIVQKQSELFDKETAKFKSTIGQVLMMPQKEGAEKVMPVVFSYGKRYQDAQAAVATGQANDFVDAFFSDINLATLSNLQKYNAMKEAKLLEIMGSGVHDQIELAEGVHAYLSEKVSPMVADVIMQVAVPSDKNHYDIVNKWLSTQSKIASTPEEIKAALEFKKDISNEDLALLATMGPNLGSTSGPIPSLDLAASVLENIPQTKEQFIASTKETIWQMEAITALATIPIASVAPVIGGIMSTIDVGVGVPSAITGKDELQSLIIGKKYADELAWWERALYGVSALGGGYGLRTAIKDAGKLSSETRVIMGDAFGVEYADVALGNGKAYTTMVLKQLQDAPEFKKLEELADVGKINDSEPLHVADQIELSDIINDIKNGLARTDDELQVTYANGHNPLSGMAQQAAMGDRTALDNLYNLVKIAADNPNEVSKLTGDIDPILVLNDFRPLERANLTKKVIKNVNKTKPTTKQSTNVTSFLNGADTLISEPTITRPVYTNNVPKPYLPAKSVPMYSPIYKTKFEGSGIDHAMHDSLPELSNVGDVMRWISANSTDKTYKELADKIQPLVENVPFIVAEAGVPVKHGFPTKLINAKGLTLVGLETGKRGVYIKGRSFGDAAPDIGEVLHEGVHAAINKKLYDAQNKEHSLHNIYQEIDKLRNKIKKEYLLRERELLGGGPPDNLILQMADTESFRFGFEDNYEFVAYGLTDNRLRDLMKSINIGKEQTLFTEFVDKMRQLLGLNSKEVDALTRLIELSEGLLY